MINRELERIYGDSDLGGDVGVLHVVAVCRDDSGGLSALRTESPDVPLSADDRLVLGVARARADVIVTTAANLRAEPRLSHQLHGDAAIRDALIAWQRHPARQVLVLTASGDLPLDHRVFSEAPTPIVVTGSGGAERLTTSGLDPSRIQVRESPSVRDTVDFARDGLDAQCVLIEAGPSTARQLYSRPLLVNELMLSICNDAIPTDAVGPQLFTAGECAAILGELQLPASGWSFHRLFPSRAGGFE